MNDAKGGTERLRPFIQESPIHGRRKRTTTWQDFRHLAIGFNGRRTKAQPRNASPIASNGPGGPAGGGGPGGQAGDRRKESGDGWPAGLDGGDPAGVLKLGTGGRAGLDGLADEGRADQLGDGASGPARVGGAGTMPALRGRAGRPPTDGRPGEGRSAPPKRRGRSPATVRPRQRDLPPARPPLFFLAIGFHGRETKDRTTVPAPIAVKLPGGPADDGGGPGGLARLTGPTGGGRAGQADQLGDGTSASVAGRTPALRTARRRGPAGMPAPDGPAGNDGLRDRPKDRRLLQRANPGRMIAAAFTSSFQAASFPQSAVCTS